MASNFTANYQLNQWEEEDAVRRVDFNADNAKIDAAIKAVDRRVDGKADTSALNSLSSTVSSLSRTVSGQGSSLSSHGSAISRLGNCAIYTGSYSGDGTTSKTLSFPGYPVLVRLMEAHSSVYSDFLRVAAFPSGSYGNITFSFNWASRSFTWGRDGTEGITKLPFNYLGSDYVVMALLDMSK